MTRLKGDCSLFQRNGDRVIKAGRKSTLSRLPESHGSLYSKGINDMRSLKMSF